MKNYYILLVLVFLAVKVGAQGMVEYKYSTYYSEVYNQEITSLEFWLTKNIVLKKTEQNMVGYIATVDTSFLDIATKIESDKKIELLLHIKGLDAGRVGIYAKTFLYKGDTLKIEGINGKSISICDFKDNQCC